MAQSLPELTKDQSEALQAILFWLENKDKPYLTVGGYAGTGKTTLLAALRAELLSHEKWAAKGIAFCSYTGKAASVLRKRLGDYEVLQKADSCSTIHSLVYRPRVDITSGEILGWELAPLLGASLIVVDEGSMVQRGIWRDLLSFSLPILVVGDHGQLPPIDEKFNLLETPDIRLEHVVRQAADNPIIQLSADIRNRILPAVGSYGDGVRRIAADDPDLYEAVDSALTQTEDSMVLCGRNRTRARLNQRARNLRECESSLPTRGERVICLRNNHAKGVYNGMVGTINSISEDGEYWLKTEIGLDDGSLRYTGTINRQQFLRETTFKPEEVKILTADDPRQLFDLFDYGYALTVHKAQGSEARSVVVVAERMQRTDEDLWWRWLYTAVTRARERLVLIG